MKIIRCHECGDLVPLAYGEMRQCKCGKSEGGYTASCPGVPCERTGILGHADVSGPCSVLGIANEDLRRLPAVEANSYLVNIVRCWAITPAAYDYREVTWNQREGQQKKR